MPDIVLSAIVTRTALGLPDLQINDGVRYKAAPQFLGATVAYNRNQVTSPWLDGAVTVSRVFQMVQEQIAVEVYGRTVAGGVLTAQTLQANEAELIAAFSQDSFDLLAAVDGALYHYRAEAADYQRLWTGPRQRARQNQIVFTMPRQPLPVDNGGV